MKEAFKKFFAGSSAQTTAAAETVKEVSEMTTQEKQPDAADNNTAEMAALLATATENFATLQSQFTELQTQFAQATVKLASLEAEKVAADGKAKALVQATRKEKLEAVLGTIPAASVFTSLETVDDNTFETVLNAFVANREVEAKSDMFQEKGVAAEAPSDTPEESAEMKILKAKYNQN